MSDVTFSQQAWEDYLYWQSQDKKTIRRINALIKETLRTRYTGSGKVEPLRGNLQGYWSRRIDESNRLVYRFRGDALEIIACRGHYN